MWPAVGQTTPPGPRLRGLTRIAHDEAQSPHPLPWPLCWNGTRCLGTSCYASFGNFESEATARSPDALFLRLLLAAGGFGSPHTPGGLTGKVPRRADARRRLCHTELGPGGHGRSARWVGAGGTPRARPAGRGVSLHFNGARAPHSSWHLRRLHFPARRLWRTRTPVKGQRKAEGGRFFGIAMKPASTVMGPGGGRPINLHDVVVRSPALPGVTLGCCRKPRLFSGPQ